MNENRADAVGGRGSQTQNWGVTLGVNTGQTMAILQNTDLRILVVDDQESVRSHLSHELLRMGVEQVLEAASAEEALAAFEQHQPDLVLLDIRLPDIDGFALVRELRGFTVADTVTLAAGEGSYLFLVGAALSRFTAEGGRLRPLTLGARDACAAVLSGVAHLGVCAMDLLPAGLTSVELLRTPLCLVMPAGHPLAARRKIAISALAGQGEHEYEEDGQHDDRDQHLVTTHIPLSVEDWRATHGALYRAAIDAGVMSVMSAHIAFPAYIRAHLPDAGREAFQPGRAQHAIPREHRSRVALAPYFDGWIVAGNRHLGLEQQQRAHRNMLGIHRDGSTRDQLAELAGASQRRLFEEDKVRILVPVLAQHLGMSGDEGLGLRLALFRRKVRRNALVFEEQLERILIRMAVVSVGGQVDLAAIIQRNRRRAFDVNV